MDASWSSLSCQEEDANMQDLYHCLDSLDNAVKQSAAIQKRACMSLESTDMLSDILADFDLEE
eukprot:scaffold2871_cov163-Amphora_coffeaeformis.AAC.5